MRQNILQVRGRTEPGATVTVNGQRVDVAGRMEAFNEFITLPVEKPGRQMVAVRVVGSTAEWTSASAGDGGRVTLARVAVFCGPGLRKNLQRRATAGGLDYEFFPAAQASREDPGAGLHGRPGGDRRPTSGPAPLKALRRALPARPVGSVSVRCDATILRRSRELGYDFHLGSWRPGDPPAREVVAHLEAARARNGQARRAGETQLRLRTTTRRLAILTDIVKTANSILEPRKIIELIMAKVQELIPSEAWSILMLDEEKQELTFELALGEKGKDVAVVPREGGGGHRGLGGPDRPAHHRQRHLQGPPFRAPLRRQTHFQTRSVLCAPLISRGHTIGVVQVINRRAASSPSRTSSCSSPSSSRAPSPSRTPSSSSAPSSSPSPTTSPSCSTRAT